MASTAFISAVLSPRRDAASGENLRQNTTWHTVTTFTQRSWTLLLVQPYKTGFTTMVCIARFKQYLNLYEPKRLLLIWYSPCFQQCRRVAYSGWFWQADVYNGSRNWGHETSVIHCKDWFNVTELIFVKTYYCDLRKMTWIFLCVQSYHHIWRGLLGHQRMPEALEVPPRGFRVYLTSPTEGTPSLTVKRENIIH